MRKKNKNLVFNLTNIYVFSNVKSHEFPIILQMIFVRFPKEFSCDEHVTCNFVSFCMRKFSCRSQDK